MKWLICSNGLNVPSMGTRLICNNGLNVPMATKQICSNGLNVPTKRRKKRLTHEQKLRALENILFTEQGLPIPDRSIYNP